MSESQIDFGRETLEAEGRIREHIRRTPLERSPWLSRLGGCDVYLKLENLQITGSFKLRGAANKLLSLTDEERKQGVVTASTGNHGSAVAYMLEKLGWPGTIFVPEGAAGAKLERMRQYRADVRFHGRDSVETEHFARRAAEDGGQVFIPPYNDPRVIGGQGTIGLELESELSRIDAVFVPVGGGGLIAGIAGYLGSVRPETDIIGCQPEASAVMHESVKAGRILDIESLPTLSDGTAGGIEKGSITFPICRDLVDRFELVGEEQIGEAIRQVIQNEHTLVEGAGALAVAAFLSTAERFEGQSVVLVLSGAKIGVDTLRLVLDQPSGEA